VFDTMPPREGGISNGWVFDEARKAGWQGNPFSDGKTATEAFAKPVGGLPKANASSATSDAISGGNCCGAFSRSLSPLPIVARMAS
jgi:hypothetical protein